MFRDFKMNNSKMASISQSITAENLLLLTDSYKISHHFQYPPGTTKVYSYFESRGGLFDEIVFFGLQYILKKWLVGKVVTKEKIQEAKELCTDHFGSEKLFNEKGWLYILDKYDGRLPLIIKAVPEGTVVPVKNVLFTVENSDDECFWLTNYVETLLVQVWYPMTVATMSREMKKVLVRKMNVTSDSLDGVDFKLHDFGFRGATSVESAGIGGTAHLVNFKGTDTLEALMIAKKYYNCKIAGFSIPAAEHSTITCWGQNREKEAFDNMITQFDTGLVAVVSDSYNIYNACENIWGKELREKVENRNGTVVIRPDSGEPKVVVLKVLEILGKAFGTTVNKKGYKVLPKYIRVIQGDGMNLKSLGEVLDTMIDNQWSVENITFGCGGALIQKVDRDTQKCAYKCSYTKQGDKEVDVFKCPVDDASKKSKKGKLKLEHLNGIWKTVDSETKPNKDLPDELKVVFENGNLKIDYDLESIRNRAVIN